MAGRPPKPLELVQGHRTKAERKVREKAESELLTGVTLKESAEVKANPVAHREFRRVKNLLKQIKKDDDLYGRIINTHCLLVAEVADHETIRGKYLQTLADLDENWSEEGVTFFEYINTKSKVQGQIIALDKLLMAKRKMILDISKENIMTIQSALRSVPKTPEKTAQSKMQSLLSKRGVGHAT